MVASAHGSSGVVVPRKKLFEVSLPLEAVSAQSAREKSIRHGLVEPGRGMSASLREAFAESVESIEGSTVDIRWHVDASESPVRLDLENRTIWLNSAYRDLIAAATPATTRTHRS